MKLEVFDASANGCYFMPVDIFHYCDWSNVKRLLLSDNKLGYLLGLAEAEKFLGNMSGLRTFAMEGNQVKTLHPNLFQNNANMTEILLAHNGIMSFDVRVTNLRNLQLLDLSQNNLPYLSAEVTAMLDGVAQSRARADLPLVRLTGNPIACSCSNESRGFLRWLLNSPVQIENRFHLTCALPNRSHVVLSRERLARTLDWLDDVCESNVLTIAVSSACALLAVVLIAVSVIYRCRWDILYWWYTRRRNYRPLEDDEYIYDAFVSYGEESDGAWVRTEVLPFLENEHGLRVCEHTRDFEVGRPIADNILQRLHESRKVLLILSEDFLQSTWCRFETQMAYHMMVQREHEVDAANNSCCDILLVVRGQLAVGQMSETLLQLVKQRTYIEWPSSREGEPAFWARLIASIRRN